jgi:hypothetical protein
VGQPKRIKIAWMEVIMFVLMVALTIRIVQPNNNVLVWAEVVPKLVGHANLVQMEHIVPKRQPQYVCRVQDVKHGMFKLKAV